MERTDPVIARKIDKSTIISLERGKIPPQAVDLEEVVLGAMMIDKKGVDEVIDILHPDAFYKDAHRHVYEAIFKLFESSEPVDLLTVSSQLKKDGRLESVGGD
ncbi:MAG: DnaB-like helicase N-terminal domain-containing protein, partial [Flavobacteriaceae bacterium]